MNRDSFRGTNKTKNNRWWLANQFELSIMASLCFPSNFLRKTHYTSSHYIRVMMMMITGGKKIIQMWNRYFIFQKQFEHEFHCRLRLLSIRLLNEKCPTTTSRCRIYLYWPAKSRLSAHRQTWMEQAQNSSSLISLEMSNHFE